jgi:hypothetical protein
MKVASIDGSYFSETATGGSSAIDVHQLAEQVAVIIQQRLCSTTLRRDSSLPSEILLDERTSSDEPRSVDIKLGIGITKQGGGTF